MRINVPKKEILDRSAQLDDFYRGNALSYGIHWLLRRQIVHLMTMEMP